MACQVGLDFPRGLRASCALVRFYGQWRCEIWSWASFEGIVRISRAPWVNTGRLGSGVCSGLRSRAEFCSQGNREAWVWASLNGLAKSASMLRVVGRGCSPNREYSSIYCPCESLWSMCLIFSVIFSARALPVQLSFCRQLAARVFRGFTSIVVWTQGASPESGQVEGLGGRRVANRTHQV